MIVIQGGSGAGSQGVAGIEIMAEFLQADLLALGPAHAVEFGGHNGIIAPLALSGKEIADVRGGSPFDFGNILSDN